VTTRQISQDMRVCTLLPPEHRPFVRTAVEHAWQSDEVSGGVAVPLIDHAVDIQALYRRYPYATGTTLIVDLELAVQLLDGRSQGMVRTPLGLLAGWDRGVLITSLQRLRSLPELLTSSILPRFSIVSAGALDDQTLATAMFRTWHVCAQLPSPQLLLDDDVREALMRLSASTRMVVTEALRHPMEWSVKQLAATCGMTRRSLERDFLRCGLQPPRALLRRASAMRPR
jgi:hypothetical protein